MAGMAENDVLIRAFETVRQRLKKTS